MLADLIDADNHWMVSASYLEYLDADCAGRRLYLAPVHFHVDSAWTIVLAEMGVELNVLMTPNPKGRRFRVRIPYDQIYNVARKPGGGLFTQQDSVYYDLSKLVMPPING